MGRTGAVVGLCVVAAAAGWLAARVAGPGGDPLPAPGARPSSPEAALVGPPPGAVPAAAPASPSPPPPPPPPSASGGPPADDGAAPRTAADLELESLELRLRALDASLREGGAGGDPGGTGPRDNPSRDLGEEERAARLAAARRRLDPLLAAYAAAPAGPERGRLLREAMLPLHAFLEAGGGFEHLPLLEAAAEEGASKEERSAAVIALHRLWQQEVVDFLLARTRSLHAEVRMYGFEGLLWVSGPEAERALQGALPGLADADPRVRGVVAAALPVTRQDPAHADLLLDRLDREEDPSVAAVLARGVLRLDPAGGRERLRARAAGMPGAARRAVEEATGD